MDSLKLFIISYLIIFLVYFIFFYILGLKRKSILNSIQVEFLKIRFKFVNSDFKQERIGIIICLIDPLIISLTGTIVSLPKWNYILQLLVGFVILIILIYSFYEILGRIIKRKVDKK